MKTSKVDQLLGMYFGLAIGDAIGTTLEFKSRDSYKHITDMVGGGAFRLKPGQWTDDTAQMVATSAALIDAQRFDPRAVMLELSAWRDEGKHIPGGTCFDIGGNTSLALSAFRRTGNPFQGTSPDPQRPLTKSEDRFYHSSSFTPRLAGGNGALCRVIPFILRYHNDPIMACRLAGESARLTNGDLASLDAVSLYSNLLWNAFRAPIGATDPLTTTLFSAVPRNEVPSDGYAPNTLLGAVWSVETSKSFEEAVLKSVNLGYDADSVGAIAGALAGARFGLSGIPAKWVKKVFWSGHLRAQATTLIEHGQGRTPTRLAVAQVFKTTPPAEAVSLYHRYHLRPVNEALGALIKDCSTTSGKQMKPWKYRGAAAHQATKSAHFDDTFDFGTGPSMSRAHYPAKPIKRAAPPADSSKGTFEQRINQATSPVVKPAEPVSLFKSFSDLDKFLATKGK